MPTDVGRPASVPQFPLANLHKGQGQLASAPLALTNPSDFAVQLNHLESLIEQFRGEAPKHAMDWMVDTLGALKRENQERAALMKRSWSDQAFEGGEEANEKTLERFEFELVSILRRSSQGLADADALGNAIDLAGAYKKNYKLDKSEAVLLRCTRNAEARGGAWLVKYLNHLSQVRMKQARNVEAMEMMYEMESLATFTMEEQGASEFYETLYRNMSSCLRSLHREDEAAVYFTKMVEAARYHKEQMDWMDLWDLGLLLANRAFHNEQWTEFYKAREVLSEALRVQQIVEPNELVLRAKVLSNLGQCYLATGEHDQADVHYSESYDLFNTTVGKRSPLFSMQAWACANLRCAQGRYAEALPLLGEALYVEATKDGLSVPEMMKLLDQILSCFHEQRGHALEGGTMQVKTDPIRQALGALILDPRWDQLEDTLDLGVLSHKMSLVYLVAKWSGAEERRAARIYSQRAVDIMERRGSERETQQWAQQVEMVHSTIVSLSAG